MTNPEHTQLVTLCTKWRNEAERLAPTASTQEYGAILAKRECCRDLLETLIELAHPTPSIVASDVSRLTPNQQ